jgi:membrane associated rhomboid family serine protease
MATVETKYCYRHPDRPTGLTCSECGRPICTECMTPAAVGLRCPEHAGGRRPMQPRNASREAARAQRKIGATDALVTKILIGINVVIYLIGAVQGAGINAPGGSFYDKTILFGPLVAQGDWWRLITSAFLHASLLHIGFNMLALWWIGAPVEMFLGRARYIGLYFVSGLAGAAGALLQAPATPTLGASGAIFGILGSMLIIEYRATGRLGGNAMTLIVINLVISFAIPGISWGGHVGGLIGGILVTLGYARFGRGSPTYGGLSLGGLVTLLAVAAASVAIAYWKVRGYA